ncbi:MAG: hypothetical protein QOH28_1618 [Actinomycetota bacterium]|nr:hypothetical protein [Actinomycetota bacterium]
MKISTTALGERFQRELVADPFNEHDRAQANAGGQLESLLVVHAPSLAAHPAVPSSISAHQTSRATDGNPGHALAILKSLARRGRHGEK